MRSLYDWDAFLQKWTTLHGSKQLHDSSDKIKHHHFTNFSFAYIWYKCNAHSALRANMRENQQMKATNEKECVLYNRPNPSTCYKTEGRHDITSKVKLNTMLRIGWAIVILEIFHFRTREETKLETLDKQHKIHKRN